MEMATLAISTLPLNTVADLAARFDRTRGDTGLYKLENLRTEVTPEKAHDYAMALAEYFLYCVSNMNRREAIEDSTAYEAQSAAKVVNVCPNITS